MIELILNPLKRAASKIDTIPLVSALSPSGARVFTEAEKAGYAKSQKLSQDCAAAVAKMLQPGWTEIQAVDAMEIWLRDHGVTGFFHKPFAWWGNRTRFDGIHNYKAYQATSRRLLENEAFILDVAPIVDGYVSDIGYSGVIGSFEGFDQGVAILEDLRLQIPELVMALNNGRSVWNAVDLKIKAAGLENIHAKYPLGVLGHRVYKTKGALDITLLNFGWQSYWELASRGIFGQIMNADYDGVMDGLWAIEPHIGGRGWGMKFEEILVVENGRASWLDPNPAWLTKRDSVKDGVLN